MSRLSRDRREGRNTNGRKRTPLATAQTGHELVESRRRGSSELRITGLRETTASRHGRGALMRAHRRRRGDAASRGRLEVNFYAEPRTWFASSFLASASFRAVGSSGTTESASPARGARSAPVVQPTSRTGVEGPASVNELPNSSCKALHFPQAAPAVNTSPTLRVPLSTSVVAQTPSPARHGRIQESLSRRWEDSHAAASMASRQPRPREAAVCVEAVSVEAPSGRHTRSAARARRRRGPANRTERREARAAAPPRRHHDAGVAGDARGRDGVPAPSRSQRGPRGGSRRPGARRRRAGVDGRPTTTYDRSGPLPGAVLEISPDAPGTGPGAVRIHPESKKKPPTTSSDGDDAFA